MASNNQFVPDPEYLGRRRFPDNKSFRKRLALASSDILSVLQNLLPSNYSKEPITNLAIFDNVIGREFARLGISMDMINNDKQYTQTRIQLLQQILGERLFLTDRIAPANYNDESYRNYLISIKNAYLKGSRKPDIEALASEFTGLMVKIKELYLGERDITSPLGVVDTHKMLVQVFIDDALKAGYDINTLQSDLDFFINLVRPAHVLYDTKLIWTEQIDVNKVFGEIFGDTGGGCVPFYDLRPFNQPTIYAQQVFVLPSADGATGQINSIHHPDSIFFLQDATRVIVDPNFDGSHIYDINGRQVTLNGLSVGDYVRITYQVIRGEFQFWWTPSIVTDYYSQFYPDIYQRPIFQENVKKLMDAQGRFPLQIKTTPTTICDRWVQDVLQPMYEDMRGNCSAGVTRSSKYFSELHDRMGFPRLSWPYERESITDQAMLGSSFVLSLPQTPVTDGSSNPATVLDITTYFDGTQIQSPLTLVDASTGRLELTTSDSYWDSTAGRFPIPGDEFVFDYHFLADGTNYDTTASEVFGIGYWQIPNSPIVSGDGSGTLARISDISLAVDGTQIDNAIVGISPLLGHVQVNQSGNFWRDSSLGRLPATGDTFQFSYYRGERYTYSMEFDDVARTFDSYVGSISTYGLVFDMDSSSNPDTEPVVPSVGSGQIGYRYRAYLLHHSSVLNSPDTLNFNNYAKPAKRASIVNQVQSLNHFNKFFSAEFLYDKNPNVVLDDQYLENGLDPVVKLNKGTPTFQQTFGYQPGLIDERKLSHIRTHHHPLMYSDLLLKEFSEGSDDVSLSSICDSGPVTFKFHMGSDAINPPSECPPWVLFDTLGSSVVNVNIPGEFRGVPNLRIEDKKLRDNLILRELEPSGLAKFSYTVTTTVDNPATTVFFLPPTFPYNDGTNVYDFPALPVMKDASSVADSTAYVTVTVDGVSHNVTFLDATTGEVHLEPFPEEIAIETQVVITANDVGRSAIYLPGIPLTASNVTLTIGTAQYYGTDFYVYGRTLSWFGTPLDGLIDTGDVIRISYDVDPLIAATIVFNYKIKSSAAVTIVDPSQSRVMDNGYVFGSMCPDGPRSDLNVMFREYFTFLSDYSEGIKISYFNKDTVTVEDHMFSGPVFEMWEASEDQIGVPDNFHNALVRIRNPLQAVNPLRSLVDYGFVNDQVARFRKKTFKELLPDRTFRTLKILEMLPV